MTIRELKQALEEVLPDKVVYRAWPVNEAPPLPYIVYYSTSAENFGADNIVYHSRRNIRIELLAEYKDITLEQNIEAVLPYWTRTEDYLEDEKCYLTSYEIEVENG